MTIRLSHRASWIVAVMLGLGVSAGLIALSPGIAAKPRPIEYPPETCANCPPGPYMGPNGGVCQPVGCVRPGGPCLLSGDCY